MAKRTTSNALGSLCVLFLIGAVTAYQWLEAHPTALIIIGCTVFVLIAIVAFENQRILSRASGLISSHVGELKIHRRQGTITLAYGVSDDAKWLQHVDFFIARVIEPVVGKIVGSAGRLKAVRKMIDVATLDFVSYRTSFSPGMDPIAYEQMVADSLTDLGWQTRLTKGSGDQGIDVIAEMRGVKVVIQCKLYSSAVGNGAVQEAIAGKAFEKAAFAAAISNENFTPSARQLASSAGVFLLHHDQMAKLEELVFGTKPTIGGGAVNTLDSLFNQPTRTFNQTSVPNSRRVGREAVIIVVISICLAAAVVVYERNSSRGVEAPAPAAPTAYPNSTIAGAAKIDKPSNGHRISRSKSRDATAAPLQPLASAMSPSVSEGSAQPNPAPINTIDPAAADHAARVETSGVRSINADAADQIETYCGKSSERSSDRPIYIKRCAQQEAAAWERLVLQREFSDYDVAIERKCNEPPFPSDSFVAKEACLKYELSPH